MTLKVRRSDPDTSHAAAASVDEESVRASQAAIIQLIRLIGPTTDRRLVERYQQLHRSQGMPPQSESGIRTRRKELVDKGLVVDVGERTLLESGRQAIRWHLAGH